MASMYVYEGFFLNKWSQIQVYYNSFYIYAFVTLAFTQHYRWVAIKVTVAISVPGPQK